MSSGRLKLAASGHSDGKVIEGKRYMQPELAAAGLWTTSADLAKFAIEVERSASGKSNRLLSLEMARSMITPQINIIPTQDLLSSDNVLTVHLKDQALEGKTTESPAFNLLPVAENEFVQREAETRYVFAKAEKGSSNGVTLRSPRREVKAPRLSDEVKVPFEHLLAGDTDAPVKAYQGLCRKDPKDPAVDENRLNGLGYRLMAEKKYREAIAVLKLNVELYPGSWNVYDSLGEAYMLNGDKALAIWNYEKSLELNPKNSNGAQMLKKLRGQ